VVNECHLISLPRVPPIQAIVVCAFMNKGRKIDIRRVAKDFMIWFFMSIKLITQQRKRMLLLIPLSAYLAVY